MNFFRISVQAPQKSLECNNVPSYRCRKIIRHVRIYIEINHIILTDYSGQVDPKPNSSANMLKFSKYRFSDTITNGLNNGDEPWKLYFNLSYCVNLLVVTQLLISSFRGIDEWLPGLVALSAETDIFLWAQCFEFLGTPPLKAGPFIFLLSL